MTRLTAPLLILAAIFTANSIIAFFAQLQPDYMAYFVGAILCLGAKIAIDYREHERDRRIAETRESVWARRLAE